jgi:hypothetical protein
MPAKSYWIGQFLLAASTMFGLLVVIDLLRGEAFAASWVESLAWSVIAAAIFIASRYRQARKGAECGLCEDEIRK